MYGNWIIESSSPEEFESVKTLIEQQLLHIERLRRNWRPMPPKRLEVPHSWTVSETPHTSASRNKY